MWLADRQIVCSISSNEDIALFCWRQDASHWRSFGHVQLGAEFAGPEFYRRDYISHHTWWQLGNIARGKKTKRLMGGVFTSQITVILITNINKNDIHYFFNSLNVHNKQKMWKERRWRKSEIQWIRTCWRLFNQQLHWSCWQEENESLQKEHKYTVNFSTLTWT